MVFNLDKAKDLRSKTEDVLIVEGYMDVLTFMPQELKMLFQIQVQL